MNIKQKTLKNKITKIGFGIYTRKKITITLKPASENSGYTFVRIDLKDCPNIQANINYVKIKNQGITLEKKNIKIHTCEHILAALVGMDLDNVIIEINNNEIPILDGSSKYYVEAIQQAGIIDQKSNREYFVIQDIISYSDPMSGSEITAVPNHQYEIISLIDFKNKILNNQHAILKNLSDFKNEISSARNFKFLDEIENLFDQKLIKNNYLSNTIIYVNQKINQSTIIKLKKILKQKNISVQPNGILNNLSLQYPNEPARHKLLDIIGCLTLCGVRLKAKIIANNPEVDINIKFTKKLYQQYKLFKKKNIPKFNLNANPIYNINQIIKFLPHRYPFLMIDKIIEISHYHIVGIKNVTFNEPYFLGHFLNEPIMPGVLQIEAMAQVGGILILSQKKDPENFSTYFIKINNVEFKKKIIPGDTIIFKIELLQSIRKGIVHMQGYAYVNNDIASKGTIVAQIIRNKII